MTFIEYLSKIFKRDMPDDMYFKIMRDDINATITENSILAYRFNEFEIRLAKVENSISVMLTGEGK